MLNLCLSSKAAQASSLGSPLFTIDGSNLIIHINTTGTPQNNLEIIQKTAFELYCLNSRRFRFIGDWTFEKKWSFIKGLRFDDNQVFFDNMNEALRLQYELHAWAVKLVNLPANRLRPYDAAIEIERFLEKHIENKNLTLKKLQGESLKNIYKGTYTAGKGSINEPIVIEVDYNPTCLSEEKTYACLIGKGVTFDSGGYSLKPRASIHFMKCDMAGAINLTAGLALAVKKGLSKRTKLFIHLCENLIGSDAVLPGDIITYENGVTVEINNTDSEGRLLLADGLIQASKHKPNLIIDAATLTSAAITALGRDYSAFFSYNQPAATRFFEISQTVNEWFWQLPLHPRHLSMMPSHYADTANSAFTAPAGASTAAAFLSRFVDINSTNWIHLDLSSAFRENPASPFQAGGNGAGIRTVANFLLDETMPLK